MRNTATVHDRDADFLTTSSVARELELAEGTIRLAARRGDLPSVRLASGTRLFTRADVEEFRKSRG